MTINCKLCKNAGGTFQVTSLIIDKEKAWVDALSQINKHILRQHHKEFQEMQFSVTKLMQYGTLFMLCDNLIDIPEDEEYVNNLVDEAQKVMMACAGFEESEEEEEEEIEGLEDEEEDDLDCEECKFIPCEKHKLLIEKADEKVEEKA
jgi:hypothetical protein